MYYYICQLIAAAVGIKTRTDSRISHHSCHITYTSQSDVRYFPRFYILTFDAVSLCVPKFLCDSSVTTELYQHSVNYNQFHNSYNSSLLLASFTENSMRNGLFAILVFSTSIPIALIC